MTEVRNLDEYYFLVATAKYFRFLLLEAIGSGDLEKGSGAKGLDFDRRVALLICGHGSCSVTPHRHFFPGMIIPGDAPARTHQYSMCVCVCIYTHEY